MGTRLRRSLIVIATMVGIVAIGLGVASLALDSYVHHHERQMLTQLESRIGRKVEVRRLSASLFSGLTADGVTIAGSSATGDQAPLMTVERIRVRPSLLRTLVTFGRRAQVAEIRLVRPTVNVVRFADGTLNLDRVAEKWQSTAPPPAQSQPMSERTRNMIENARIKHARIDDGHIHFVDRGTGGRAVDVTALDLALADVGIRRHPSIDLRAAVMAANPNLTMHAQIGSAGTLENLPPRVESAQLKLARTDLAPIAPLLTRLFPGFEAGVAEADLEMQSHGSAKLRGTARLSQARFAGGAPFDAKLDADVAGEERRGDVDVRRLDLSVANMSIVAHGQLKALRSDPRFEQFAIDSRNVDFDQMRHIHPQLDREMGAAMHGPVQIGARASEQQFSAFVDLTNASVAAPGRFEKPRGTVWRIEANGRAQKEVVELQSLTVKVAQQVLRAHGTARVGEPHPHLDLYADTDGISVAALAPLLPSLAKEQLPPIVLSMNAHLTGRAGVPESMAVDVEGLAIRSRKTDLTGSVKLHNLERPDVDLRAQSTYLDTADLLPSSASTHGKHAPSPAGGPSPMARLSGHAVVSVTRGIASGVPFDGLKADVAMRDGVVHANQLEVGAWGGHVVGSGSELDAARGPFHLVGRVDAVDVEQMLAGLGSARKILSGRLSAQLDLHGQGTESAELERTLAGTLDGSVDQAQLLAFNFDELLVGQLVRVLPFRLPTQRLANATSLGTLHGQLHFADGAITLAKPLTATTPEGPIELAGRFFFDGRMDLTGTLQLQPAAASALFANRIRLSEPLPLSLRLGGSIHQPSLGIPNIGDAAKALARGAVGAFIPGRQQAKIPSQKDIENDAVKGLKGLLHR